MAFDLKKIKYYNCNKKSYYWNNCIKLSKKLFLVLANSAPITGASRENEIVLKKILYIYYLLYFCKDKKNKVQALINFASKVNVIILAYGLKLDL